MTKAELMEYVTTHKDRWADIVRHTEKELGDAWKKEGILEECIEQMVVDVRDCSSSEIAPWNACFHSSLKVVNVVEATLEVELEFCPEDLGRFECVVKFDITE
ncbi:hypothetical protein J437_LFUL014454 [Ladona fulva]|uniref:Uncharacterized protein n=1 Tax=Ladona fulva TaxID=123851 RepID=A0A8K0KGP8_LADFU|nr:hypothetical protein J437_LFUL014454 [Ladona fulva]